MKTHVGKEDRAILPRYASWFLEESAAIAMQTPEGCCDADHLSEREGVGGGDDQLYPIGSEMHWNHSSWLARKVSHRQSTERDGQGQFRMA
jgi:hypothetical protein